MSATATKTMTTSPRPKLEAGLPLGPYFLVERLGKGGFGEVWRARRPAGRASPADDEDALDGPLGPAGSGGVEVALKIPTHPLYIRHLRTEGAILDELDHPNIVSLIEVELEGEIPYIVMEYVEGRSVRDAILRPGLLEYQEIRSVAEQTLIALDYLHGRGFVHRDLKPENILIDGDGVVKLIDFGLGHVAERVLAEAYVSASLVSRDVPCAGTLAYMSPEQRRGSPVDARSDLYSFGVVLHEMLTDELPRPDLRVNEMREDVSLRHDVLLLGLLHPDLDKRVQTAEEARRRLVFTLMDRATVRVDAERSESATRTALMDERLLGAASPFAAGQIIGGDLELQRVLGRGGFGEVWVAHRINGGDEVAVKLALTEDAKPGLALEEEIGRRITHPSIPKVHEARLDDEHPHLVMELVRGRNLWEHIREHERFDVEQGLAIFRQMVEAVRVCHDEKVVHRDLKPGNFIYDAESGRTTLLDFGLCQVEATDARLEASLVTRSVVGTVEYMAPEQRGSDPVGPAADIYALGICLYEMLTGSLPKGQPIRNTVRVPEWVDRACSKMLSREPHARPTARRLAADIETGMSGTAWSDYRPSRGAELDAPLSFGSLRPIVAGWVAGLALLLGLYVQGFGAGEMLVAFLSAIGVTGITMTFQEIAAALRRWRGEPGPVPEPPPLASPALALICSPVALIVATIAVVLLSLGWSPSLARPLVVQALVGLLSVGVPFVCRSIDSPAEGVD